MTPKGVEKKISLEPVLCCYCGMKNITNGPPAIVKCVSCKRDFRVYRNYSGGYPIELSNDAKNYFAAKEKAGGSKQPA